MRSGFFCAQNPKLTTAVKLHNQNICSLFIKLNILACVVKSIKYDIIINAKLTFMK